jgi:hypothetical protein
MMQILCRRGGRKALPSRFLPSHLFIGENYDGSPDSEQPAARRTL